MSIADRPDIPSEKGAVRDSDTEVREDLIRQLRAWADSNQNQHGRGGLIDQAADELAYTAADLARARECIEKCGVK